MPDFESIQQEYNKQSEALKLAENEMMFVQASVRSLSLRIKPVWPIFVIISEFIVECMRAISAKQFRISLVSYIIGAVVIAAYVVYAVVMAVKNHKYNQGRQALFMQKRLIYEGLHEKRRDFFESFVAESGGIALKTASTGFLAYLWYSEDAGLTIVMSCDSLQPITVPDCDIRYISCDERLSDYNRALGTETTADSGLPYCYIFTREQCFIFTADGYSKLCALMPKKELSLNISTTDGKPADVSTQTSDDIK